MNLPVNFFLNRFRFDRIVAVSLWPTFLAHPVDWRQLCGVAARVCCRQPKRAGVYLMGTDGEIPAHSTTYMETACTYNDPVVMHPFAYRTHAHTHGTCLTSDIDTGQLFTALPDPDPSDAGPNPLWSMILTQPNHAQLQRSLSLLWRSSMEKVYNIINVIVVFYYGTTKNVELWEIHILSDCPFAMKKTILANNTLITSVLAQTFGLNPRHTQPTCPTQTSPWLNQVRSPSWLVCLGRTHTWLFTRATLC